MRGWRGNYTFGVCVGLAVELMVLKKGLLLGIIKFKSEEETGGHV